MKRIYIDEFHPKSELVTPCHTDLMPPCPVIDAHTHFGPLLLGDEYESTYDTKETCKVMKELGIEKLFCLELVWDGEYDRLCKKLEDSDGMILPIGSVDVFKAKDADFDLYVYKTMSDLKSKGSIGIKLWKNMTLMGKERFGENLRLDDPLYAPLWQCAAELDLPVIIHVADPPCFFRPTDSDNEHYVCLSQHPDWSFYKEGIFSFEEHMKMQENVIASNPTTKFVVAHIGSYAENLAAVSEWLDKYPNMNIDIAARVDQLGRQPYSARAFIEKYQDRILFGTDYEGHFSTERTREFYHTHYRFLQSRDEYFRHPFPDLLGQWRIYGIDLPDDVLIKIYRNNAIRLFGLD